MQRNISLDYFKLLLSILILGLHALFLSELPIIGYGIQQGIARLAVPCFFIINGYFLHSKIDDFSKTKLYIKRLLIPYLIWMTIYIPFHHQGRISSDIMPEHVASIFAWLFGWGHLWYVSTLIMSTIVLYCLKKNNIKNKALLYTFILFYFVGYILQRLYLFDIDFQFYAITRTFLFMGLPFIFIGYYIKANSIENSFRLSYRTYLIIVLLIVTVFIESYLPPYFNRATDFYLALPLVCPLLFIVIMKNGRIRASSGYVDKLSTAIYFCHLLVLILIREYIGYNNTRLFLIAMPTTFLISTILLYINKRIRYLLP